MATKLSPFKNTTDTLKLGERNAEVRAVGAWVEPEYYNRRTIFEAVISAKEEEQRLNQLQYEKQQQLKQFQLDVKKRVQALAKQQRQQQLQKSYQAVEVERNVLSQSAAAAERSTPRKNRCAVRDQESLTVRHSAAKIHSQLQGAVISTIEERTHGSTPQELQRTTDQIHKNTVLARNKLMKCRLGTDVYEDTDLPGGRWTNDVANAQPLTNDIGEHNSLEITKQYTEAPRTEQNRTVHFEFHEEDDTINPGYRNTIHTHSGEITRAPQLAALPQPSSAFAPPLHPDQLVDDQKHLAMKQRATYRRLFMDIEREQVKENQRRQEHRKHINKFKKDKENERERLEAECWKSLEIADPVSGDTMREAELKQQLQQQAIIEEQEARAQRQQKNRDMQRYVEALRCNLRENVTLRGIDLPALCCCGESVWDTNPDTCANNCVFYKNHKAYAKALQALLTSCDVV